MLDLLKKREYIKKPKFHEVNTLKEEIKAETNKVRYRY